MADSRSAGHAIVPWEGTGWPVELFKDKEMLTEKRLYFCNRNACGKDDNRILKEPIQLDCGHRVCKKCLDIQCQATPLPDRLCDSCVDEYQDEERQRLMARRAVTGEPMDFGGSQMESDARPLHEKLPPYAKIEPKKCAPDRAAFREINKLEAICPYGCPLVHFDGKPMAMKHLERHMNECPSRLVPCDKCTEPIKFTSIADHMNNDCPFRVVECPNGCGKRGLQGKDLAKHQAECEKKPPICRLCKSPFEGSHHAHLMESCIAGCPFGCQDMKQGELIIKHLEDPSKLQTHVYSMYNLIENLKDSQQGGTHTGTAGMTQQQMTAILDRLLQLECRSERTERQLTERVSQMSQAEATGFLENAGKAATNKSALEEMDSLFKVTAGDVHLLSSYDTTFRHLADRVNRQEAETTERLNKLEGLSNIRLAEIEDQKTLLNQFQMTSFNGRLLWRIDRVQSKRNEAHIRHSIFSHPFYTEVYGYKMCARIYFNGDGNGKNSHISLFFVVMKGDFDALLPWPFQQKVTMKLKNQTKKRSDIVEKFRPEPSSSSFAKPKNEMNIASGCPQFATQELVFDSQSGFVVDDTMFIEIIVDNSYEALHGLNVSVQETRGSSSSGYNK